MFLRKEDGSTQEKSSALAQSQNCEDRDMAVEKSIPSGDTLLILSLICSKEECARKVVTSRSTLLGLFMTRSVNAAFDTIIVGASSSLVLCGSASSRKLGACNQLQVCFRRG